MAKPIILAVDDEPQVLNAVMRDLRSHYSKSYRVIAGGEGADALKAVVRLKQRGDNVALFLVDQRMPKLAGTDFLEQASEFFPEAKKVLLTAYADTDAAIQSINSIGLDFYLMKPWDPPEQNLFPILDDLLSDWEASVPIPYEGMRVLGTLWSPASHEAKDFLSRNQIPYQWLDLEHSEEARLLVQSLEKESPSLPVVFMPDGSHMEAPSSQQLADSVGIATRATQPFYDHVIVGAGPAGLASAVYGTSEGLRTLIIEKQAPGGQAGTSSRIENYLGFPKGLTGADLARRAVAQAKRFGTEFVTAQEAKAVRVDGTYKTVELGDGTEVSTHALTIASGVRVRVLDKPGISRLAGAGIYYGAALTEASYYEGRHMYVVGGANSAGQGAMFFSRYAKMVTMLVRGTSLASSMSQYLIDQIGNTDKIEVKPYTEVVEAHGDNALEQLTLLNNRSGETWSVDAGALFIFIGAVPHSAMVADLVKRNNAGFIYTGRDLLKDGKMPHGWRLRREPYFFETSSPGVFAVGDVRHGSVKRVATAVGEGAASIQLVHQYLKSV